MKICVQRLVELRSVDYNQIQTGPVAGMGKICMDYGLIEYIRPILEEWSSSVQQSEWKTMVKGCAKEKQF